MSTSFWLENLQQTLKYHQLDELSPRIAVVGIGHELCGDDAIGPLIVQRLASLLSQDESLLILDAGSAPENFTGILRRFSPDFVLLIDAAQMGKAPGGIGCVPWQDTVGLSASTHSLPLHIFAQYLSQELSCEIVLLGIQPKDCEWQMELSPNVRASIENVTQDLALLLSCYSIDTKNIHDFRANPNKSRTALELGERRYVSGVMKA